MKQQLQIDIIKRSLTLLEQKTTDMLPQTYHNPATDYTCRQQLQQEYQQLFYKKPIFVGFSRDAANPGDWFTYEIAARPVVIVRDENGILRAYLNACRHRGMRVATGKGSAAKYLICPYHSWAYKLTGELNSRPFEQGFCDTEKAELGLRELPLLEIQGLIFVRAEPGEPITAAEALSGIEDELTGFDFADYELFEVREEMRDMNWKLGVDTFLEAYHIHHLHSESIKPYFQNNRALFDCYGDHCRMVAIRESIDALKQLPEQQWDLKLHGTLVYQLFPNTAFIFQLDHVELYQFYPDGDNPNRCHVRACLYAPGPINNDSARRHWKNNFDLVEHVTSNEDFVACEAIQQSCATGLQENVLFGRNEPCLIHYHKAIRSSLGLPLPA